MEKKETVILENETIIMLNIYERINAVMNEVQYIRKEGSAKGLPYKAVSHDAVVGALHMPMVKHGIVVVPSVVEMTQDGNRTIAKIDVSFVNASDPSDSFKVTYYGYGVDNQDKGPGKAFSYAIKYAMLKTFCLETGDDPERDNIDYKVDTECISPEQLEVIEERINGYEGVRKAMLAGYKGSLQNIPAKSYSEVLRVVDKRIEDAKKKETK